MAHINILPWREDLRKQRQKEFGIMAGIGAAVASAIVGLIYLQVLARHDGSGLNNKSLLNGGSHPNWLSPMTKK